MGSDDGRVVEKYVVAARIREPGFGRYFHLGGCGRRCMWDMIDNICSSHRPFVWLILGQVSLVLSLPKVIELSCLDTSSPKG